MAIDKLPIKTVSAEPIIQSIFEASVAAVDAANRAGGIESRVSQLEAIPSPLTFMGGWDATSGNFPASTRAGEYWSVDTAGTVDGEQFEQFDVLVAVIDGASSTTFAGNWYREPGGKVRMNELIEARQEVLRYAGAVQGTVTGSNDLVFAYNGTSGDLASIGDGFTCSFEVVETPTDLVTFSVPGATGVNTPRPVYQGDVQIGADAWGPGTIIGLRYTATSDTWQVIFNSSLMSDTEAALEGLRTTSGRTSGGAAGANNTLPFSDDEVARVDFASATLIQQKDGVRTALDANLVGEQSPVSHDQYSFAPDGSLQRVSGGGLRGTTLSSGISGGWLQPEIPAAYNPVGGPSAFEAVGMNMTPYTGNSPVPSEPAQTLSTIAAGKTSRYLRLIGIDTVADWYQVDLVVKAAEQVPFIGIRFPQPICEPGRWRCRCADCRRCGDDEACERAQHHHPRRSRGPGLGQRLAAYPRPGTGSCTSDCPILRGSPASDFQPEPVKHVR